MVVQHNITAMNANRYYGINNSKLASSLEKLSSGYKINRAGDDAAGLAVSEKMRSQIAGMTQGVKNAQAGISMVQTFEGALTETHSILQRMKTLADQMANGSYDDAVDRTAAEQEFLQLNDELDQIADTDYNGVIVLNGGVMADGLKVNEEGEFNYADKAGQVAEANAKALADAQTAAQAKIDKAQNTYDAAYNRYAAVQNRDRCINGEAVGWNSLDNSQYTSGAADKLFQTMDITGGTTALTGSDVGGDKSLQGNDVESIEVTYRFTKTGDMMLDGATPATADTWEISGGTYVDEAGQTQNISADALKSIFQKVTTTSNGGFIVSDNATGAAEGSSASATYGNVVLEGKPLKSGDVVTLTYTNAASTTEGPTNIGIDQDSLVNGVDKSTIPTLELDANIKGSTDIDQETAEALDKLNNATVSFEYSQGRIDASISDADLQIAEYKDSNGNVVDGKYQIYYKNAKDETVNLATVTTTKAHGAGSLELAGSTGAALAGGQLTVDGASAASGANTAVTYVYGASGWAVDGGGSDSSFVGVAKISGTAITIDDCLSATGTPMAGDKVTLSTVAGITTGSGGTINVAYTPVEGATVAVGGTAPSSGGSMKLTYTDNGWVDESGAAANLASLTIGGTGTVNASGVFKTGKDVPTSGDTLTISWDANATAASVSVKNANPTLGNISFGVALDQGTYDISGVKPTILPSTSTTGVDSRAIDQAFADAKAALDEAKAAYPNSIDDLPDEYKVSTSDAFDNSEAIMTYKDNITLQVGARTKDAVNFTFQYNSDAIGDLDADLNCTAKGLGTDKLTIATQDDANFAVDKIDQAINKVSLIRGSFGAIQNRLNHKIDNLNVSVENLTDAESKIRDTDMSTEMMEFTKNQILAQASQSMLAQANTLPQNVLSLLQ